MQFFENRDFESDAYLSSKNARINEKKALADMENYSSKKTPKLYQMSMMYLANKMDDDSY